MEKLKIRKELQNIIKTNGDIDKSTIGKAEEIKFNDYINEIYELDNFGFIKSKKENKRYITKEEKEEKIRKINEIEYKWYNIVENFNQIKRNDSNKLKELIREGIPDSLRANVWEILAGIDKLRKGKENLYKEILNSLLTEEDNSKSIHKVRDFEGFDNLKEENIQIEINGNINKKENKSVNLTNDEVVTLKDIHRTFPRHFYFKDRLGKGQRELFHVLISYANFNKKTGYVQGMGFLTALFLTYFNEETSFWMLHSLMVNYDLEGFFMKDFPELRKCLFVFLNLLKRFMPNIYNLLKKEKLYPTMFASQWFITFYSCVMKFDQLVRIYDCLFYEGFKIIYRIALGLFKLNEEDILRCKSLDILMETIKKMTENIDIDILLKESFKFSFSRKDIKRLEAKFNELKLNTSNKDEIFIQVNF